MNRDLKRILKKIAKKIEKEIQSKNLKRKRKKIANGNPQIEGLREIREIKGLSFDDGIIFWGLTDPSSNEEPWSRVSLNNWFIYFGDDATPLQFEIVQRIRDSGHRDKEFNCEVKDYLEKLLTSESDIPAILLPILTEKFKTIYS